MNSYTVLLRLPKSITHLIFTPGKKAKSAAKLIPFSFRSKSLVKFIFIIQTPSLSGTSVPLKAAAKKTIINPYFQIFLQVFFAYFLSFP
jgi:hypothetical protein